MERTGDSSSDRQDSMCNSTILQNGECDPEENSDRENKTKDLTRESLLNGKIKEEALEDIEGRQDKKVPPGLNVKVEVKTEVKEEELNIKEEKESDDEIAVKDERFSDGEGGSEKWECNGTVMAEGESTANEEESKTRTKELPPVYDPAKYLPRQEDFELVVASVEQLRTLIKKFGDLPENAGGSSSTKESKEQKEAKEVKEGEDTKEEEEEEDKDEEKEGNTKKTKVRVI